MVWPPFWAVKPQIILYIYNFDPGKFCFYLRHWSQALSFKTKIGRQENNEINNKIGSVKGYKQFLEKLSQNYQEPKSIELGRNKPTRI